MGMVTFKLQKKRRIEAMRPENIKKQDEVKLDNEEEKTTENEEVNEEVKERVTRGSNRKK